MIESFVMIQEDYKKVHQLWMKIADSEECEKTESQIICDDMRFEDCDGWCLIILLDGENFAEEVLLQLSAGKKLLYFFSDESQLDCEFLVIDNNTILRKKYIYCDTPELDENEGHLQCEDEHEFLEWYDIDYFIEIARDIPEKLFVVSR